MKKTHIPKTPRPPPTAEKIHNPIREEIHVVQMESLINLRRTTELLKKSHTPQKIPDPAGCRENPQSKSASVGAVLVQD